jgi:hypothetical protein
MVSDLLGNSGRSVARVGSLSGYCPALVRGDGIARRWPGFEPRERLPEAVVFTAFAVRQTSL